MARARRPLNEATAIVAEQGYDLHHWRAFSFGPLALIVIRNKRRERGDG